MLKFPLVPEIGFVNWYIVNCLQKNYKGAVQESSKALELDPNYVKALLRRAQANESLEKFEEALTGMQFLHMKEVRNEFSNVWPNCSSYWWIVGCPTWSNSFFYLSIDPIEVTISVTQGVFTHNRRLNGWWL